MAIPETREAFHKFIRSDLRGNISNHFIFYEYNQPTPTHMEQNVGNVFTIKIDRQPEFILSAARKTALDKPLLCLYGTIDNYRSKREFGNDLKLHGSDQNAVLKILEIFKQAEEIASDFDEILNDNLLRPNMKSSRASENSDAKLECSIWEFETHKSSSDESLDKIHGHDFRKQNQICSFVNVTDDKHEIGVHVMTLKHVKPLVTNSATAVYVEKFGYVYDRKPPFNSELDYSNPFHYSKYVV